MNETESAAETTPSAAEIEAARAEARRQGYAEAREVVELCALAGMPERAAAMLAQETAPAAARQQLMEARVAGDAPEIRSHVEPGAGTEPKTSLTDNPVVKAVEKLAGKGMN